MSWYAIAILMYTSAPPNIFTNYQTVILPWSFPDEPACQASVTWTKAQLALVAPPSPTTRTVFGCVQL
jgi:hypothetical protein